MNQTFTFADRLKSAMEQKHMKQVDLIHAAETAGVKVGKSHISQYVSGKTIPRNDILHFLAVARRFLARRFFISYLRLLMSMLTGFLEMEGML